MAIAASTKPIDGWHPLAGPRHAASLAFLCLGVSLYTVNAYIFTTAVPTVVADIGGLALVSWASTVYIVASLVSAAGTAALKANLQAELDSARGAVLRLGRHHLHRQALLVAIEADLEASPWEGEGYRKVWARLRVCRDIRVARKRVLRLMRENNLLSPHRCRRRGGNPHDGEIITHAPNLMWGTDGVRVFTVDDGWGWIFTAVEHWNAECVGWHVCKRGDRFAALQPISMGLAGLYGSTAAGAARGLALRMDHGSQYLSDHFTNQIKFWGIQPSYAFVAEPQTNGVAERFNRTLKEQIIHGRIYRNIAELRDAVRDFVELYNAQWIVEKNGYLSPAQARQAWHAAISIRPAA